MFTSLHLVLGQKTPYFSFYFLSLWTKTPFLWSFDWFKKKRIAFVMFHTSKQEKPKMKKSNYISINTQSFKISQEHKDEVIISNLFTWTLCLQTFFSMLLL